MEQQTEAPTPRREGFQREVPGNGGATFTEMPPPQPEPPIAAVQPLPLNPPSHAPPQPPLPSQLKMPNEPPAPPEPPLDQYEAARRDVREKEMKWPVVIQLLYKPVKTAQGQELWALTFRQPRAADINRVGNPTRVLWDGEIIIEERKMTYIMAALANIQPTQLEDMDPRDWNTCALGLRKFFLADLRGWPPSMTI